MSEKGLGKGFGAGLGALFGDDIMIGSANSVVMLPISRVEPRQDQPRTSFDEVALEELADSLREYGMIQPITVRKLESGYYQIIAGERRWRAARKAGLSEVPARVMEADDKLTTELALVENLQREDLNPIEEARGYKSLMTEYGMTQEQAAQRVGKSRPAIANALRLLSLENEIMQLVEDGYLSAGHARALLGLKSLESQWGLAQKIMDQELSVRQTEVLVAKMLKDEKKADASEEAEEGRVNYMMEVEKNLSSTLGRRVKIDGNGKKGYMKLEYYSREDMEVLISKLNELNIGNKQKLW